MTDQVFGPTPFQYDFVLEGKAAEDIITEDSNGDLIIEGWAAVFEGVDRQGENFTDGAFKRGVKAFMDKGRALCYHHKHDQCIGEVLNLEEVEGKGLKMRARVDFQPESSPLRYIYNGIKKGTLRALSVGGFFQRAMTEKGPRINDMDFTEISVTPVPVHTGPSFSVVAGKALEDLKMPDGVTIDANTPNDIRQEDEYRLQYALETIGEILDSLSKRVTPPESPAA